MVPGPLPAPRTVVFFHVRLLCGLSRLLQTGNLLVSYTKCKVSEKIFGLQQRDKAPMLEVSTKEFFLEEVT